MRWRWLALAFAVMPILAGCSFSRRCIVSETDAAKLAPFIMPGPADIGRTYRMRGLLLTSWEEAFIYAADPGEQLEGPNEMRYCFRIDDPCVRRAIQRLTKPSSPLLARYWHGGSVDAVVEYLGKSSNSDCWLGEVRIVRIISIRPLAARVRR
ncbi:MAG: hypothetical protein NTW95_14705 [Candidatus Aminicenantes bacterium]|nr:hypothetical protein [Candidatus Aminicenantes bacterium]